VEHFQRPLTEAEVARTNEVVKEKEAEDKVNNQ
jgi:hypothetical protein